MSEALERSVYFQVEGPWKVQHGLYFSRISTNSIVKSSEAQNFDLRFRKMALGGPQNKPAFAKNGLARSVQP